MFVGAMAKILLVEDDNRLRADIRKWLELDKHTVEEACDGAQALEALRFYKFDLIVLDWDLPSVAGIDILKTYRGEGGSMPVLFLTGKSGTEFKRQGLDGGADDYLTKPFDFEELSARLRALLRRPFGYKPTVFRAGELTIDTTAGVVSKNGEQIHLAPKEFALLEFFLRNPGQVFSPEAVLDRVWESESDAGPDMVRATLRRLRKKIGETPDDSIIENVHGVGYRLKPR
jgi:DNA-binding response OmpR family regulator